MKKQLWNLVLGFAVISGMIGGWFDGILVDYIGGGLGGSLGEMRMAFAEGVKNGVAEEASGIDASGGIESGGVDENAGDDGDDENMDKDEKIVDDDAKNRDGTTGIVDSGAENSDKNTESDVENDDEYDEDDEAEWERPELFVKALNPGYKIDDISNVGEMIEIARGKSSDTPILLAGAAVGYTNTSGNFSILFEFPENSWMTGESILLRLASSPGSELANATYTKTLALGAKIELILDGETIDEVCYTGKTGCYKSFVSDAPTTLVRDLETGEFKHESDYEPEFVSENYEIRTEEAEEDEVKMPQCVGLEFSEILSYYEADPAEQFIELYNPNAEEIKLDGCKIRYKNNEYILAGAVEADGYFVYRPIGFKLTKNPVNVNTLELVDIDETVVDTMEYPNGQKEGTAYALVGYNEDGKEIWATTYDPTPGEANNYQRFKTCTEGKVINEATGNCVKVVELTEKVCEEGYHLNILTGRCNKDEEVEEKTCKEGYYLNPETNRCRKIQENTGADYEIVAEEYEENSAFVATIAVGGVVAVGLIYLIWEFREEIGKMWRKILKK